MLAGPPHAACHCQDLRALPLQAQLNHQALRDHKVQPAPVTGQRSVHIYIYYIFVYIYVYVNSCGVDTNSLWSHSRARQSTQAVGQSHGGQLQSSLHVPRVGHAGHVQPTAATTAVVQTGSFPLTRVLAKLYQNYINIEWVLDKASMSYACGPRCPTNERSSPGKLFFNNQ